ncbi:MAG: prepilin-type N-terminal cleavage/methylation domain-containing protein [Phycisphaerae bacterium]|nr:prepilin-type N-terminal cleavage/methylation domain-containing protein [Phycisphaerae bacterium]
MSCGVSSRSHTGFTLMEAVTALAILAVIISGVLVAVNQNIAVMIDNRSRVQAFELVRENMERLLGSDSVTDTTEFGVHELTDDIQWQNVVESFNEPVNSAMWIRAVCSASYTDRDGERQTISLTHWITDLTKAQEKQILDQKKREQDFIEEMDGNPFGEDPDGLMQYANALAGMGDYARAAETASQLILNYPGEPQAAAAWPRLLKYPELALAEGDTMTAGKILDRIAENHRNKPEVEKINTRLRPYIVSGQPYVASTGSGSGGTTGSSTSAGSTSQGGNTAGSGSSGAGNSGQNTGSAAAQPDVWDYPNPNWSPEQKKIWDAFRNL